MGDFDRIPCKFPCSQGIGRVTKAGDIQTAGIGFIDETGADDEAFMKSLRLSCISDDGHCPGDKQPSQIAIALL